MLDALKFWIAKAVVDVGIFVVLLVTAFAVMLTIAALSGRKRRAP